MSWNTRRDVLTTLSALIATGTASGIPFREKRGEVVTGVVDRIVSGLAVVLIERDGELVDQTHLDADDLPKPAQEEGAVLELVLDGDQVERVRYDAPETRRRRGAMGDRFDDVAEVPEK